MICRLCEGEPLAVSSFEAFYKICRAKFDEANQFDHRIVFGCRKCETGLAIKEGRLTGLPENVPLLGQLPARKPKKETLMTTAATTIGSPSTGSRPAAPIKPRPGADAMPLPPGLEASLLQADNLHQMTAADLRAFWVSEPLQSKKPGVCPNCRREITGAAAGLCGGCYSSARKKQGRRLLVALSEAAGRLGGLAALMADEAPARAGHDDSGFGGDLSSWKPLPANQMAKITPNELLGYWLAAPIRKNQPSACPNCRRMDMTRHRFGLCHSCSLAAAGKIGHELLGALNGARDRLYGQGKLTAVKAMRPPSPAGALPGYEPLHQVLTAALDQAQVGKGRERHANGKPFLAQPIMEEIRSVGLGFGAGQARKKILEAIRAAAECPDRAKADLLGAINYVAAVILAINEGVTK